MCKNAYIYTHYHSLLLKIFRASCRHGVPSPINTTVSISQKQTALLSNPPTQKIGIDTTLPTYSYFIDSPNNISFFSGLGSYPWIHVVFSFHVFTDLFSFLFPLSFMSLTVLGSADSLFFRMTLKLGPCAVSSWLQSSRTSLAGTPQKCAVQFPVPCIHRHVISNDAAAGDWHLDCTGVLLYLVSVCVKRYSKITQLDSHQTSAH